MIKHTLTKKQQIVIVGLALFGTAFLSSSKRGLVCIAAPYQLHDGLYCSVRTIHYLMSLGIAGRVVDESTEQFWALTPDGVALAKVLIKVLS